MAPRFIKRINENNLKKVQEPKIPRGADTNCAHAGAWR